MRRTLYSTSYNPVLFAVQDSVLCSTVTKDWGLRDVITGPLPGAYVKDLREAYEDYQRDGDVEAVLERTLNSLGRAIEEAEA